MVLTRIAMPILALSLGLAIALQTPLDATSVVQVARDLATRRTGDVVVLDRISRHVQKLFGEDDVLSNAASFSILTRIKTTGSTDRKLRSKGLKYVGDLRDIAGIRVVVDEGSGILDDEAGYALCYRVLHCLATSPFVFDISNQKDYVRAPKSNGYRSLHATITPASTRLPRFEIQVRTREMDAASTHGTSAHIAYKDASAKNELDYS